MNNIHITVSVSMHQKSGKLVFNALAMNKLGLCTSTKRITILEKPYSEVDVGNILKAAIHVVIEKPYLDDSMRGNIHELLGLTKSKFIKEYSQVMVDMLEEKNLYVFSPMKRDGTRGYKRERGDKEFELVLNSEDAALGKTLLEAFTYCI